jgi:hypothetical protein
LDSCGECWGHGCNPNGILGLLCREYFPGLVEYAGVTGPAYTFDHYDVAPDAVDYKCPSGLPGTNLARARSGTTRYLPGPCRVGPAACWATTGRALHWPSTPQNSEITKITKIHRINIDINHSQKHNTQAHITYEMR